MWAICLTVLLSTADIVQAAVPNNGMRRNSQPVPGIEHAGAAVSAALWQEAPCSPISTLPCSMTTAALPYSLTFDGAVANSLPDKNGIGTGFKLVDTYSGARASSDGSPSNANVPGYEPSRLSISAGQLLLQTHSGIAYATNNNQLNALGVKFDTKNRVLIETTINKPYYGTSGQQAGIWFGLSDKTFLKLVVLSDKVEMRKEVNDVTNDSDQFITQSIAGLNESVIRLRLVIDPVANTAHGFYSTDGISYFNVSQNSATASLSIADMGATNTMAYAGIFATHRKGSSSATFAFNDFSITPSSEPLNRAPVVVKAPVNQIIKTGQAFAFPAGEYSDPDAGDVLTYSATLEDGSPLPAWLQFKAADLAFSGTGPQTAQVLSVKVNVTDKQGANISTVFKVDVQPAGQASNASILVENLQKFPELNRMVFSQVQIPANDNRNNNDLKLRITNTGSGDLQMRALQLSDPITWQITKLNGVDFNAATDLPLTLSRGKSVEAIIRFAATSENYRVLQFNDTLTVVSNDDFVPKKKVYLHGLLQYRTEGNNEPYGQEIISAFGFKTRNGFTYRGDNGSKGSSKISNSDEIISAFFVKADASKPVQVLQMAAYRGCCSGSETIEWYAKDATTNTKVFTDHPLYSQSLMPRLYGYSSSLAQGSFNPSGAFGLKVDDAYSDRTRNYSGKIGMRIWKAIDNNGNVIPNAYIVGADYLGTATTNYDYQDNIYYISNIKPESGTAYYSELSPATSDVDFGAAQVKGTNSRTISLKNLGQSYEDGTSDPSIKITNIEITGANAAEFSVGALSASTLAPGATASLAVNFKPISRGIKNADMLVHYNNSLPLRIPLYGIANDGCGTITAVKRIKGAADASITIAGLVWESDASYRKGSIKLDRPAPTPIAATDKDELYQTYLSAASDLAETRYEIPVTNGSYLIRMHFVENFFTKIGGRVFNVSVENELKLANLDIYKEVSYKTALVKDFETEVKDGVLTIKFNPSINRVALAGVEIFSIPGNATPLSLSTASIKSSDCTTPNGAVELRVSNGSGKVVQYKSGPAGAYQTSPVFSGLAPGTYMFFAREEGSTCEAFIEVVVPSNNSFSFVVSSEKLSCTETTGSATVSNISGGSGNFGFAWNTNPVQTGKTATNLAPGIYQVTVTDNASGCSVSKQITVNQDPSCGTLIANVASKTSGSYVLANLVTGVKHYTDRSYEVTTIPSYLEGAPFIRTPNNDKSSSSAAVVTFDLLHNANLYVAYDPRATILPSWLQNWQRVPEVLGVTDGSINSLVLYTKAFPAGPVSLGGNMVNPAAGASTNYIVIANYGSPSSGEVSEYSLVVTVDGNGTVSKSPNQSTYASGSTVSLTATPAAGYKFIGWTGAASGSTATVNLTMDTDKAVTATFRPEENTSGLISNIASLTGRSYLLAELTPGVKHYTDRSYDVTSVPSFLQGAPFIRTPNNDKTNNKTAVVSFNLNQNAVVYVAYDPRATTLPAWLDGWQKESQVLGVNDASISAMNIYSKNFLAGQVTLGGNMASPATGAEANYVIIAQLANSTLTSSALIEQEPLAEANSTIVAYPNPVKGDKVQLSLKGFEGQEKVQVSLYDMLGRIVHTTPVELDHRGDVQTELSVRNLKRGVYLLRVKTNAGTRQIKLLVQ
ncbi:malectin domain-containing carbohydrate-binding protein [Pontibacter sp. CAU 1760]